MARNGEVVVGALLPNHKLECIRH
eukprot:COSAG05_NODE_10551_length_559_cov_1.210870_1_plen_23_part_10